MTWSSVFKKLRTSETFAEKGEGVAVRETRKTSLPSSYGRPKGRAPKVTSADVSTWKKSVRTGVPLGATVL